MCIALCFKGIKGNEGSVMGKRALCVLILIPISTIFFFTPVLAQGLDGNSYYTLIPDWRENELQHFTWTFSSSSSGGGADNETEVVTDNETQSGTVMFDVEDRTFDNSTGTYLVNGNIFTGSWEGAEENYSNYYEENITTYYSFLFFGVTFANDFFTAGISYSNITTKSSIKGTEKESRIVPFFGIMLSTSANGSNFLRKRKIRHMNAE